MSALDKPSYRPYRSGHAGGHLPEIMNNDSGHGMRIGARQP